MRKRANNAEIVQRIGEIATLLIKGESRENIVRFSTEKYGVKERMTEKYIAKAKLFIEESVEKKINYDYSKAVMRYEELYKHSFEEKDYRTCLSINKELTILQGLNKVQIEHSGNVEFICNIPN